MKFLCAITILIVAIAVVNANPFSEISQGWQIAQFVGDYVKPALEKVGLGFLLDYLGTMANFGIDFVSLF